MKEIVFSDGTKALGWYSFGVSDGWYYLRLLNMVDRGELKVIDPGKVGKIDKALADAITAELRAALESPSWAKLWKRAILPSIR